MKTIDLKVGSIKDTKEHSGTAAPPGVAAAVSRMVDDFRNARSEKETIWKECWAAYLGTPAAIDAMRSSAQKFVGDVNNDWRHKINTGKSFEIVETVNAYLQGAMFPNRDWFELMPLEPGVQDSVKSVKALLKRKQKEACFTSYMEMYTRQLLITGFSVMALPWEKKQETVKRRKATQTTSSTVIGGTQTKTTYPIYESQETVYNNARYEVVSGFDCYIDPLSSDPRTANFIRVLRKTKGEVIAGIESGFYPLLDPVDVARAKGASQSTSVSNKKSVSEWLGVKYDPSDLVEMHEFWGDMTAQDMTYTDVVCTVMGDKVARFEPNPFWGGKPFVIGVCIPIPDRPYGLGVLEPVLGQIHQLNVITNQRLDSLELAVDSVWTVVNDGVTDPEDIFMAPGKIIEVASHDSVRPVQKDTTFTVSYTEAGTLEQNIDKTVGTGAYIGTQQGRSGERVTATEIQAVRDAGGNRLSSIHGHIEQTQLLVMLRKYARMLQQFTDEDEVVRLPGEGGSTEYTAVGPAELNVRFDVEVAGAGHVADKQFVLQKTIDYVGLVAQFPQFQEMVNWQALLHEITKRFGFDDEVVAAILTVQQQEQGMAPAPQSPVDKTLEDARAMGGIPLQEATEGQMQLQGANSVAYARQAGLAGQDSQAAAAIGALADEAQMMSGVAP